MIGEVHELSSSELDSVSGGFPWAGLGLNILANLIYDGLKWGVENAGPSQYNTTGRGDNNGCTGHQC